MNKKDQNLGTLYRHKGTKGIYLLIKIESIPYGKRFDPYFDYELTFLEPGGEVNTYNSETIDIDQDWYWKECFERIIL